MRYLHRVSRGGTGASSLPESAAPSPASGTRSEHPPSSLGGSSSRIGLGPLRLLAWVWLLTQTLLLGNPRVLIPELPLGAAWDQSAPASAEKPLTLPQHPLVPQSSFNSEILPASCRGSS